MEHNQHLYDWWFTYNPHTEKWAACQTQDIPTYKNQHDTDRAIRSSSIITLQSMIIEAEGSLTKLQEVKKKYK